MPKVVGFDPKTVKQLIKTPEVQEWAQNMKIYARQTI
jgi:hypothetical protein